MTRRKSPAPPQHRAPRNTTNAAQSSTYRRQDGYAAPTAEDRLDAQVIAAAKERGFSIAVRCTRCGQWVVAAASVAAHMGPVCRAKAVGR